MTCMLLTTCLSMIIELILTFCFIAEGPNKFAYTLYGAIGVLIYGCFISIDLAQISKQLPVDDFIVGALTLYIDIMRMFIYILRIVGQRK